MTLSFGEHRVEDAPGVVDGDQPKQRGAAGVGVDLDHRDVRTERIGRLIGLEVGDLVERIAGFGRRDRDLGPGRAPAQACRDVEAALDRVEDEVVGIGLEQVGGDVAGTRDDGSRRLEHCRAAQLKRSRPIVPCPRGRHRCRRGSP